MIHHTRHGDGPRPVVFLHGLFGQGRNFTSIAKALVAWNPELSCFLLDLPNHGRSGWTETLSYPEMAQAVADSLSDVGDSGALARLTDGAPVALVGHSMGGKVAMRLALDHPDLVERLVVVDISPIDSSEARSQFSPLVAAMQNLDLTSLTSREDADHQLAVGIPDARVRGFLMQNLRSRGIGERATWSWQMNLDLLGRELDQVGRWDATGVYDGPVLWVAGDRSDYVKPEYTPAMKAHFPRTRTLRVKDAGHWVHAEQPEAFTSCLQHFLSR